MDEQLIAKIEGVFPRLVVDKRQALRAGFEQMPRFVTEFLIAAARERNAAMSIDEVRERIGRFSVDSDRKKAFVSELMTKGQATLIAQLDVEPRLHANEHIGHIAQLDGNEVLVPEDLVTRYRELLYGGLWGSCTLRLEEGGKRGRRILVEGFTPYQLTRPDLGAFREARREFSLDEWLDLLITSAGYRPEAFRGLRSKLLVLTRLVPLAQTNVNLVELGPRGTGKSYLLRSLSGRVHVLAGAKATPASLFYDLRQKQLGILGTKKVVIFDEVTHMTMQDPTLLGSLKEYLASGIIERAGAKFPADASIVFAGNLDLAPDGRLPSADYGHLFEALPRALRDPAIGERLHGFIPGWEFPKISDQILADGTGFLSDYFGEVLVELRKDPRAIDYIRQTPLRDATTREDVGITRVAAGLLRMVYPDMQVEAEGFEAILQLAVELRQRVHNQLTKMAPGEYRRKSIHFDGIAPSEPLDFREERALQAQDVLVNQQDVVGKITILTVSSEGGGDVGFVECAHVEGGKELQITGLHAADLNHSVRAAYDALLHLGRPLGLPTERLRERKMSLHLVNISAPKGGPSAGLAFALAMLSAATGRAIRKQIAVTGELSVHGDVHAIGGLPEKLTAAADHGRKLVIIPADNAAELMAFPELCERLDVRPVRTLREAVELALLPD